MLGARAIEQENMLSIKITRCLQGGEGGWGGAGEMSTFVLLPHQL
jgi:hypothetical protein